MLGELSVLVALTVGLTQTIKLALKMESRFKPLTAVLIGIILTFLSDKTDILTLSIVGNLILDGIMVGLISVGLYDNGKVLVKRDNHLSI